ncbi:hypothetical protein GQF42_41870 [Streptomyces broussonetiae]|uniref:Uncharacterized protein n=1 Tax=Streptomyces broussonetiae TaxID=2686304 RepID=A0A6I6NDK8_9ACTN|nr:hypothetical protein GQF42_41870 [Streptomyces broussonetiae]
MAGRAAGARRGAGHRVAPDRGPPDNETVGYGYWAGRVQNQLSRRVCNGARRLPLVLPLLDEPTKRPSPRPCDES